MKIIKGLFSPLAAVLGLAPKAPKIDAPQPIPTRDAAIDQISAEDALRKRRGGAADILTGSGGAEAAAGSVGRDTLG